jgi:sirohydrochlorin cobaltochelatase
MQFKDTALILAGHGSTKNADSSRFTRETAHRIREREIFSEVRSAFWKEQPSYADALQGLKAKKAVVVPWFLANGYFTTKILKREFAEIAGLECRVTEPIGSRPEILGHFQKRAERLLAAKNWKPNQVSLLIASHGTPLHAGSRGAAVSLAEQLAKDGYRKARAVFLEEEPKIADWRVLVQEGPVVVLPHFLAGGLHGSEDVPELLGISGSGEGWYRSEKDELGYGEPLGRPEEVEEMIIELAAAKA